jgi:hypothetical protein
LLGGEEERGVRHVVAMPPVLHGHVANHYPCEQG